MWSSLQIPLKPSFEQWSKNCLNVRFLVEWVKSFWQIPRSLTSVKYPYLLFFLHFALYLTLHPYGNCWTENVQWSWTMLLRVLGQSGVLKKAFHPISFLNGLFEIVTISKHLLCLFSKQCTWNFFSRTIIYPKSVSISRGGLLIYFNKLFL